MMDLSSTRIAMKNTVHDLGESEIFSHFIKVICLPLCFNSSSSSSSLLPKCIGYLKRWVCGYMCICVMSCARHLIVYSQPPPFPGGQGGAGICKCMWVLTRLLVDLPDQLKLFQFDRLEAC